MPARALHQHPRTGFSIHVWQLITTFPIAFERGVAFPKQMPNRHEQQGTELAQAIDVALAAKGQ